MTTNIQFLNDTLSRRIAHGAVGEKDLMLLQQLLLCERRRCMVLGLASGAGIAAALLALILTVLH